MSSWGRVVEAVRPHRSDGHGATWRLLMANHDQIKAWLEQGLRAVKVRELLARQGVVVPERTLHHYTRQECGHVRGRGPTVRAVDGEPGGELQVDFGKVGLLFDPDAIAGGRAGRWYSRPATPGTASSG